MPFDMMDRSGAVESARRQAQHRTDIARLKRDVDPTIDVHAEQLRATDRAPIATESGTIIDVSPDQKLALASPLEREELDRERTDERRRMMARTIDVHNRLNERKASGGNR